MQVNILNGTYVSNLSPDFRTSYPVNMVPVAERTGISNGYLRTPFGVKVLDQGPGRERGAIVWNEKCYRVMGTKLVLVQTDKELSYSAVVELGDVGGAETEKVRMDYSFDRLAIASDGKLFYYNEADGLVQVVDPDIGQVRDVVWIDGYFMVTDGEFLTVTELADPTAVNPLKYGSSEADPDPVKAVLRLRNEVYAINRYTIEVFTNVGGDNFPFERIEGAQVQRGALGPWCACVFNERIAILGSARNEAPGIYLIENGQSIKISTREIDLLLSEYSLDELAFIQMEQQERDGHKHLYVHLEDRTAVYDFAASQQLQQPVWFYLTNTMEGFARWRARNFVWVYGNWLCGNEQTGEIGYITDDTPKQWGSHYRWEINSGVVYNENRGAIVNRLELVAITGQYAYGDTPSIGTSYSADGTTWSQERWQRVGLRGNNDKRLVWHNNGMLKSYRIQRFRSDSTCNVALARFDMDVMELAW